MEKQKQKNAPAQQYDLTGIPDDDEYDAWVAQNQPDKAAKLANAPDWTKLTKDAPVDPTVPAQSVVPLEFALTVFLLIVFIFIAKKIKNSLDTPSKRAWAVAAVVGTALFSYGYFTFPYYGDAAEHAFDFYGATDHPAIFFGFWLSFFGYSLSWFYDFGAGRIVEWVKRGG